MTCRATEGTLSIQDLKHYHANKNVSRSSCFSGLSIKAVAQGFTYFVRSRSWRSYIAPMDRKTQQLELSLLTLCRKLRS